LTKQIRKFKIKYRKVNSRKEQKQMKKLEEILRDKPIKNKLSFAFRIMDILYVVLALVAVVELIRSKGYIGSIVVVVLLVLAIIFNASMSKMLAKMLIDPITNLVTASEKIASGDFEIGVPYESEDELGRLSDSFETAAAILKKVVSDLQTIVEQFSDGNFDVHSSCPEAYVGQLRDVLDELDEMVNKVSETMHGIQDSSEQVSAGSNQLAVSAQDIAEGATHQAASVEERAASMEAFKDSRLVWDAIFSISAMIFSMFWVVALIFFMASTSSSIFFWLLAASIPTFFALSCTMSVDLVFSST